MTFFKQMYRKILDRQNYYYSPLTFGLVTLAMTYMGLALAENPNKPFIPGWVWFSGIPLLVIGIFLQVFSRRVLWIRVFHALLTMQMSIVFAFVLWEVGKKNQISMSKWTIEMIVGMVFSGCLIYGYMSSLNHLKKTKMPHGAIGMLNFKTGSVDPMLNPKEIEAEQANVENVTRSVLQWGPLFVGLLMALTQIFGNQNHDPRVSLAALIFLILGALGLGGNIFYISSIWRWEQRNKKHIYVK